MLKYILAVGCAACAADRSHIAEVQIEVGKEIKQKMSRLTNFNDPNFPIKLLVAFLFVSQWVYGACLSIYP